MFVKNVCFPIKLKKKIPDPWHDVTDDYSIQGKFLQQLWIPYPMTQAAIH